MDQKKSFNEYFAARYCYNGIIYYDFVFVWVHLFVKAYCRCIYTRILDTLSHATRRRKKSHTITSTAVLVPSFFCICPYIKFILRIIFICARVSTWSVPCDIDTLCMMNDWCYNIYSLIHAMLLQFLFSE